MHGKIALVTGGTNGIDAATVQRFLAESATEVATGSNAASVGAAWQRMPGSECIVSDAGDVAAVTAIVDHVRTTHGRVDVLSANAGVGRKSPIDTTGEAVFDRLFNINVRSPYALLKHAVTAMTAGGSIILTSSAAAVSGIADTSLAVRPKPR